jgi:bacteriophage N4 adsorption protein B
LATLDYWIAQLILPLAGWVLVSGLDDLFLNLLWAFCRLVGLEERMPSRETVHRAPPKRMALFVPLWQEAGVIERMLRHNLALIRYSRFDVFVGCYPNDGETIEAVRRVEAVQANVHLAMVPHDGPTSKADCLNAIYRAMAGYERAANARFEVVLIHDAEDLIHPESLEWINYFSDKFDMVQVPVLPLETPVMHFTHGIYCDEFAEYQTKDVPMRRLLGSFVPSNGVGTGYRREALEKLAESSGTTIFDPTCLTEDYECGLKLYKLGCRQLFLPIRFDGKVPMATREYFPRRFGQAIRQRTRWVTGIALQSWERNGWGGGLAVNYWFWRDRKGLIGNPAGLLMNAVFLYGAATYGVAQMDGTVWHFGMVTPESTAWIFAFSQLLQAVTLTVRCHAVGRIYGLRMAATAPLRITYANIINSVATISALGRYLGARLRRRPLPWLKTDHVYPAMAPLASLTPALATAAAAAGAGGGSSPMRAAIPPSYLERPRRAATEPAVGIGGGGTADARQYIESRYPRSGGGRSDSSPRQVRQGGDAAVPPAPASPVVPAPAPVVEKAPEAAAMTEDVPVGRLNPSLMRMDIARTFPARMMEEYHVLPFEVENGRLLVATPYLPSDADRECLAAFTRLELKFHLVPPDNFELALKTVMTDQGGEAVLEPEMDQETT